VTPADSPALRFRSPEYPPRFGGLVPRAVLMRRTVRLIRFSFHEGLPSKAERGHTYPCWVNSHGAVAAILEDGTAIGVKPDEFEVTDWHQIVGGR
jgi:hypothetical protein